MFNFYKKKTNGSDESKKKIVELFNKNVKGKKPDTDASNINHDGKEGHWLETQMNIPHNAANLPDILGYEMKDNTKSKTSFGDWSADYYLYKDKSIGISRDDFIKIFGKPNQMKGGRYSWSGEPCPKGLDKYNDYGQMMTIDKLKNINIFYSFDKDKRSNKENIVPSNIQKNGLLIVQWESSSLKNKVERKFNNYGWFKCVKNKEGIYSNIVFGDPINFNNWISGVLSGLIFFDSGMYQGNSRNYSQWRAYNNYWDSLITDRY